MRFLFLTLFLAAAGLVRGAFSLSAPSSCGNSSMVSWDEYSVKINDERVMIYSAEVHGFRYPGASSWLEVFQKLKAAGFNTISTYFFWGLVEYKQGTFNWDGFRNPQAFFDAAMDAGLYVIARPGPYINAEVSAGGFPGWLQRIPGPARNSGDNYTTAYMPYIEEMFQMIARNQIDCGGPVIALQLENEYDKAVGGEDFEYEEILSKVASDAGIIVPTTHNGALSSGFGNYFIDNVDIWGYDEYPATKSVCPGPDMWDSDAIKQFQWEMHLDESYNRGQPMAIFEFEGGFKQAWGDVGYCGELGSVEFQKMFFKNKYAMATTLFNIYMAWGGTNWGNMASPDCYTSYDFGAMITEDRQLRTKYYEAKVQGHFLRSSPAFLTAQPQNIDANTTDFYVTSDNPLSVIYSKDMEKEETKFFFIRHTDASFKDETEYSIVLPTSQGDIQIPQLNRALSLRGRDTKIHVVDYVVGQHALLYSSAEVMSSLLIGKRTVVVLYGDHGQEHETAVVSRGRPRVHAFGDAAGSLTTKTTEGRVVLNYRTKGKTAIEVGGNLLIYVLDRETAYSTWPDIENNVLVLGGYLIRSAKYESGVISIEGDFNETTSLEVVAPGRSTNISVNGHHTKMKATKYMTIEGNRVPQLPGIHLPDMAKLEWKFSDSLPEISRSYNDSMWTVADLKQTLNPNGPTTPVSLMAGDYGYHHGIILWRGHFKATGGEEQLTLHMYGGAGFGYTAYEDGTLIHSWTGEKGAAESLDAIDLSNSWAAGDEHVITIVQDHMGYDMSWTANTELFKEPRGVYAYNFTGANGSLSTPKEFEWKVQGNLGGEDYVDQTRGPFNEGGLFAERLGWHLPDFPDGVWESRSPYKGTSSSGVVFYRTTFDLRIPVGVDYPLSLQLPEISLDKPYRAILYVNGYQIGRYASSLGPQTKFPIPPTLLNMSGKNTLGVALWSMSDEGAAVLSLTLGVDAKVEYSGPTLLREPAPKYNKEYRLKAS